jgi:hypothetical protein
MEKLCTLISAVAVSQFKEELMPARSNYGFVSLKTCGVQFSKLIETHVNLNRSSEPHELNFMDPY